jgi:uncharacterized membrane protein
MVGRIGEWPWKGIYSLVAIVGFVLIVMGYGEARQNPVVLYVTPSWLRHVALLLLVPVFPLLVAAYLPGRIKTVTKHPMLWATKLWAFAHLLSNGMLADVFLFGAFLIWAVADRISVKHRVERALPGVPPTKVNDVLAILIGLVIYGAFLFWLHVRLIGVSIIV